MSEYKHTQGKWKKKFMSEYKQIQGHEKKKVLERVLTINTYMFLKNYILFLSL